MMKTEDFFKLLSVNDQLDEFNLMLNDLKYLGQLSCETLLEKYYPAILDDNTSPFTNFTQEHRDSYTKLKFRAINKRYSL